MTTSEAKAVRAGSATEHELLAEARLRVDLLGEVTSALTGSLNLRRTVLRLLDLLTPRVADWAMVVLVDDTSGLTLHGGADPTFATSIPRALIEGTGVERVLRSGQDELLHVSVELDSTEGLDTMIPHPRLREEAVELRPADVLSLALTARGSTIGTLVMIRGAGRGFPDDDVEFAGQIASQASIALDSARLYQERGRVASILQASLRPPDLPAIPGARVSARFRPAAEHLDIGGDFYDVHGAADDWLLVLGDVCGKGVEAAVLTGRARQGIRMAAYFDRRPSAVLKALNDVLCENDSSRFVTVVCARFHPSPDGSSAEVDIAVAGHPAPIVVHADGEVEQVEVAGIVAGVVPGASYTEVRVRIEAGDTMLMFTDGVDEARGSDGFYGMDRLLGLLPDYAGAGPVALCEAVERSVVEYLDGRAHDDIALLAVSCER
ncbi:PP2C family protein-serine/threonine phosphatase [Umezawaea endophytica]|uniref:SpoIIE family protein phosphatase n=1 Tax=Umezawaea endophytica TaxID=1654476 RepID=A0A9X2VGV9_9PSEU|nr:GAF domain-containing SpoIIE family protein phosphatase [Umezawaea endophytica]MCS7475914.1 SpoIIE family protein phosphatase [Umezawaea endophytica]